MCPAEILLIAIILILLIYVIFIYPTIVTSENFDTYRNHDFGAYEVYKEEGDHLTVPQAALKAKYDWAERDVAGYTVYDRMYDDVTRQKIWASEANKGDDEYGYRDVDLTDLNGVYDTKFSILDGENQLSTYHLGDMYDPNIVFTEVNGQKIYLAQKQY